MKNKLGLTFSTFLIVFCLCLFTINHINAQEYGIYELKVDNSNDRSDKSEFYNLTHNLHSTLYIANNAVQKVYGKAPYKKITILDSKSYSSLKSKNNKYKNVELITLVLESKNDLNMLLDLSNTTEFSNLKYVHIKCLFKSAIGDIKKCIKVNPNVRVFYISEIPS